MSESWVTKPASQVKIDDRIRAKGYELTVTRIEENFFGRDGLRAFIEDSDQQWLKMPMPSDSDVEIQARR